MTKPVVSKEQITAELHRLGVAPGDLLIAHSSLRAFGWVEGGAEAVVDALLAAVGPTGTVMVPTFNHGTAKVYDPAATRSTNGAVTEALRKRPEAIRSMHPSHPYAAIGPRAEELTAGNLEVGTFDPKSPLGKLAEAGGWVVLLGVGMEACTAVHIGEAQAEVHCLGYGRERSYVRIDGVVQEVRSTLWREDGPCQVEGRPVEQRLRARDLIRDGQVGPGEVHLMRASDVVQASYELCLEQCPKCPLQPDWKARRAVG
jgi:aminoglycoside 3-N-acetyltransferase